jgi:DNA-binding IclR family transcriptional regulator
MGVTGGVMALSVEGDNRDVPSGTLERGLAILEFFAARSEASAAVVADALGVSRSATYRILDTLRDKGFLELNPATQRLRLGIKAAELGMAALTGVDVIRLAPSYLQRLAELTSETVFLAVMDNDAMVYVHQELGPQPVKLTGTPGSRHPIHCTSLGKAFMSAMPDDVRQALISRLDLRRFTDTTITNRALLEAEILRTRERGYAIDNAEGEEGVVCFGAPVYDHRGLPVAAVSVSGPAERIKRNGEKVGKLVASTAADLSRRLGYITSE